MSALLLVDDDGLFSAMRIANSNFKDYRYSPTTGSAAAYDVPFIHN